VILLVDTTRASQATQAATNGSGVLSVIPSVLWFALATFGLFLLRKQLRALLENLSCACAPERLSNSFLSN
jgi:hypothetical protein